MSHSELIGLLKDVFEQRRSKNRSYSLRAYARSLGLHSATLSTILTGKRPISPKRAAALLNKLGVTDEAVRLRYLAPLLGLKTATQKTPVYSEIDLERFAAIRDWEHSAILIFLETRSDAEEGEIARRLDISRGRVKSAIERLIKVGLLERAGGGWKVLHENNFTPTDVPNADVRECHRQYIEKALESLADDPLHRRDITGTTITLDPGKMPLLKDAIREFRRKVQQLADDGGATEVYRLNVQLFPLTKETK